MNASENSWFIRLLKGALIGSAFVLPGISGGAVAVVLGLYERLIVFLADIRKDFLKNILFFLPVGIGGAGGLFIFAAALNYAFGFAQTQILWFFIGCICGTLPGLWKKAGEHGRQIWHLACIPISAALIAFVLTQAAGLAYLPLNIATWLLSGAVVAFGVMVPGLSTATLLIMLGLYQPMTSAVATMDFGVILPVAVGAVASLLAFSRVTAWLFQKAYTFVFHAILGFVGASTVLIIPDYSYTSIGGLLAAGMFITGLVFGRWIDK